MEFGRFIATCRKKLGMSQKGLAAKIIKDDGTPISPQYLNDIERDRRNPPTDYFLDQFALVLGVSKDEVYFHAGRLPSDVRRRGYSQKKVKAAFQAFRQKLR